MRSSLLVGLVAGLAIGASAYAGDDISVPVESIRVVPRECFAGPLFPKDAGPRGVGLVYQNTAPAGFYNSVLPPWIIDDVSLTPGNSSAVMPGQLITGMTFGFSLNGTAGLTRNFDVVVEFFDSYDAAATVTPAWITSLGSFRVSFTNVGQAASYTTNLINLTTLPAGGIQLADAGCGVSLRFVEPGTDTLVTATGPGGACLVTPFFASNHDTITFSDTQQIGSSGTRSWRDSSANGIIVASEGTTFAWPTNARFYMELEGIARCPADYNNDGFVDGMDADMFNTDFETLCF